jgi:hypothetical protein
MSSSERDYIAEGGVGYMVGSKAERGGIAKDGGFFAMRLVRGDRDDC